MRGTRKFSVDLSRATSFLQGLTTVEGLFSPSKDVARFMFTRAEIMDPTTGALLGVPRVLWDSGALHGNYISKRFLDANYPFLKAMVSVVDSAVTLADNKTSLRITQEVEIPLLLGAMDGSPAVTCVATFSVIECGADIILGLPSLVGQVSELFIAMIRRAVGLAKFDGIYEKFNTSVKRKVVHVASNSGGGARTLMRNSSGDGYHVRTGRAPSIGRHSVSDIRGLFRPCKSDGQPGKRPGWFIVPRSQRVALKKEATKELLQAFDLAFPEEADERPPWSVLDDLGPEEASSPFPGLFSAAVAFMETSIPDAQKEYLLEVNKPPPEPGDTKSKSRFSQSMIDHPGFMEFMRTEALDVFVPTNWEGINAPEIEFNFKEDMPDTHRAKARPINPARADLVKKEFDRLTQYHLRLCKSSIVSPITDADKATAPFVRICGDYRWVNKHILLDHQHIPRVQHELERFRGFKYFIDLDMANSFHQFKLGLKTSEKLSIITPWGTYRPIFMPEGVSPATGVLQSHMREIFKEFSDWSIVIFDNFCIGGNSMEELMERFKLFIAKCKEYNVFLKFSKCYFGFSKVKFFGYEVDGSGWEIDDTRKEAVMSIPFPEGPTPKLRRTRMQSFLGFALYFRDFVKDYSVKASLFYEMTVKDFSWDEKTWTVDYRAKFAEFKVDLVECFRLIFPDYSLPWVLQPDASSCGIGAILYQLRKGPYGPNGAEGVRKEPIACVSQKFSGPATRWAVIKQEMYAIYRAVEKLQYYLMHKPFQIQTDHSNLVQMEKSNVGIITRWRVFLQSFPVTSIIHVAGKDNIAADFLSRVTEPDNDGVEQQPMTLAMVDGQPRSWRASQSPALLNVMFSDTEFCVPDELAAYSLKERGEFIASLVGPVLSCREQCCASLYCGECGGDNSNVMAELSMLCATTVANGDAYTAVQPEWDAILRKVHGARSLHWGAHSTWRLLNEQYPGHKIPMSYVRYHVRECDICQKYRKTLNRDRMPAIIRHLKVPGPRSTVGIDGFTISPPDKHGNAYMHVIVNHFTKHVYLYPSKNKEATSAADALITYVSLFGRFRNLISDPGSDYSSRVLEALNGYFGYEHAFSLVDRHESNGVEATNRELKRHLQALVADTRFRDRWSEPQILGLITFHMNAMRSSESGFNAFDLTFGALHSKYFDALDAEGASFIPANSEYVKELDADIKAITKLSKTYQQNLVLSRATDRTLPWNEWVAGDYVFVDNTSPVDKLQGGRLGPYQVVKQYRNDVRLRNLVTNVEKEFHVDRLSAYSGTPERALRMAMLDTDQHFLERFIGYRGNPQVRQTVEFLVEFTDGTLVWKPFDADIVHTVQCEQYCRSLPELRPLLFTAKEFSAWSVAQRKIFTSTHHAKGDVVYVDIRARALFAHEWYNALVMEDKDVKFRFARMRIGGTVTRRGSARNTRCELIDDVYKRVHIVDSVFLHLYGTRRLVTELPPGSEVIDAAFAVSNPQTAEMLTRSRAATMQDLLSISVKPDDSVVKTTFMSWNVNSIKAAIKKGLLDELINLPGGPPDVLMLQEIKLHIIEESQMERQFARLGYEHVKMVSGRPHHVAGVLIASKTPFEPLGNVSVEDGRCLGVRVNGVTGICAYCPIVWDEDQQRNLRRQEFDEAFLKVIDGWPKPHVICTDTNCVGDLFKDLAVPQRLQGKRIGFTSAIETHLYTELMGRGYVDTYRSCQPDGRDFTVFPHGKFQGLKARVDHVFVDSSLHSAVTECVIGPPTDISDHAYVLMTIAKQKSLWIDFSKLKVERSKFYNLAQNKLAHLIAGLGVQLPTKVFMLRAIYSASGTSDEPTELQLSQYAFFGYRPSAEESAQDVKDLWQARMLSMECAGQSHMGPNDYFVFMNPSGAPVYDLTGSSPEQDKTAVKVVKKRITPEQVSQPAAVQAEAVAPDTFDISQSPFSPPPAKRSVQPTTPVALFSSLEPQGTTFTFAAPSRLPRSNSLAPVQYTTEQPKPDEEPVVAEQAKLQLVKHKAAAKSTLPPQLLQRQMMVQESVYKEFMAWKESLLEPSPEKAGKSGADQQLAPEVDRLSLFNHAQFTTDAVTLEQYEASLVEVWYNPDIPPVQPECLKVRKSFFRAVDDNQVHDCMGDELIVTCPVKCGQGIAFFSGRVMSNAQVDRLPANARQYLITVEDDEVLDCSSFALSVPPGCYASKANQADSQVYSYHLNRHLTLADNNTAVEAWRNPRQPEHLSLVLYALRDQEEYSILMWHYGPDFSMFDPGTPTPRKSKAALHTPINSPATPNRRQGQRFMDKVMSLEKRGYGMFDASTELAFEGAHKDGLDGLAEEAVEELATGVFAPTIQEEKQEEDNASELSVLTAAEDGVMQQVSSDGEQEESLSAHTRNSLRESQPSYPSIDSGTIWEHFVRR